MSEFFRHHTLYATHADGFKCYRFDEPGRSPRFVMMDGLSMVGNLSVMPHDLTGTSFPLLFNFAVQDHLQGRGLGNLLIASALQHLARETKHGRAHMETEPDNGRSRHLMEKFRFHMTGSDPA